jgi:hypothetical protein
MDNTGEIVSMVDQKPAPTNPRTVQPQPELDDDDTNDGTLTVGRQPIYVGWSKPVKGSPGRLTGGGYCLQTQIGMNDGDYNIVYVSRPILISYSGY